MKCCIFDYGFCCALKRGKHLDSHILARSETLDGSIIEQSCHGLHHVESFIDPADRIRDKRRSKEGRAGRDRSCRLCISIIFGNKIDSARRSGGLRDHVIDRDAAEVFKRDLDRVSHLSHDRADKAAHFLRASKRLFKLLSRDRDLEHIRGTCYKEFLLDVRFSNDPGIHALTVYKIVRGIRLRLRHMNFDFLQDCAVLKIIEDHIGKTVSISLEKENCPADALTESVKERFGICGAGKNRVTQGDKACSIHDRERSGSEGLCINRINY